MMKFPTPISLWLPNCIIPQFLDPICHFLSIPTYASYFRQPWRLGIHSPAVKLTRTHRLCCQALCHSFCTDRKTLRMKSIHHSLLLEAACFTLHTQTILSYYDRKPPAITVLCVKLCTSWINAFVQLVQYTFLLPCFSAFPSVFYSDLGSTKSAKLKRLYTLSAINRYFLNPLNLVLWDTLAFICTRLSTMFSFAAPLNDLHLQKANLAVSHELQLLNSLVTD